MSCVKPLEEQPVILTTEPSLHVASVISHVVLLRRIFFIFKKYLVYVCVVFVFLRKPEEGVESAVAGVTGLFE